MCTSQGPIHSETIFDSRNIPRDVLDFLTESQSINLPVVYVSFGTLVRLTEERFYNIYEGLASHAGDKWRVLWSSDKVKCSFVYVVEICFFGSFQAFPCSAGYAFINAVIPNAFKPTLKSAPSINTSVDPISVVAVCVLSSRLLRYLPF